MAASASGIITLLVLIFIGPAYYLLQHHRNKKNNNGDENCQMEEPQQHNDRDVIDSSQHICALVGYAIGVGNIWRFPCVIAQNGGASALVAHVVCAIFVAVPLFLHEMIVGQHVRLSAIHCYEKIQPRWQSLGVASGVMLFLSLSHCGMVVAHAFPHIWNSLKKPLPWAESGAEAFWTQTVLNSCEDLDAANGLGPIQVNLAVSLVCFWAIVCLTVGFGRDVLAKITHVTALLPVLIVAILVIRTAFLDGAGDGIKFYLGRFDAKDLLNLRTWAAACGQILFSLSPAFGTAIAHSSCTKPKEDVCKACMIVAVSNSAFSIIAGLATFSMVGHMAKVEGGDVADIATREGMGLAFVTVAEAMTCFGSLSNFMSVIFFSMLLLLGLDSAYALEQTFNAHVVDFFEDRGWPTPSRSKVSVISCSVMALVGLIHAARMGHELLTVVDHFVTSIFLLIVAFVESIMLNLDFAYERLEFALRKATFDNPSAPNGRRLSPFPLCKLDFHVAVPAFSILLAACLICLDAAERCMGYPAKLVAFGWVLLGLLILISVSTLWKKAPSALEPCAEEDVKIRETTLSQNIGAAGDAEMQTPEIQIAQTPGLS